MKTTFLTAAAAMLLLAGSCTKEAAVLPPPENLSTAAIVPFIIPQGQHYSTASVFKTIETAELRFTVRFDSSAIYQTADPANQYDINKLYGFSDNGEQHHLFSARFGWRWSDGALRLFAYTYNNGIRDSKELGTLAINHTASCSIKVKGNTYLFTVDGKTETMPRKSSTALAKGYQLYPYFGGDEAAPHEVRVWIRED